MGVDLTLYIPTNSKPMSEDIGMWLADTKLHLDRDERLFDIIKGVVVVSIPMMACDAYYDKNTDQDTYGDVTQCPTGEPLTLIPPHILGSIIKRNCDASHERTIAAAAYLCALPKDYPVILYWN